MSSKPVTPIRRSNSRPGSGSSEVPLTSSLEVLAPYGGGAVSGAGDLRASKNSIPLCRASSATDDGSARRSTPLKQLIASRHSEHQSLLPLIPLPSYGTSSSRPSTSSAPSLLPSVAAPPHAQHNDLGAAPSHHARTPSLTPSPAPHSSLPLSSAHPPAHLAPPPSSHFAHPLPLSPALGVLLPPSYSHPPTLPLHLSAETDTGPTSPPLALAPLPPLDIDKDQPPQPTSTSAMPPPHAFPRQSVDVGASTSSAFSALFDYGDAGGPNSARASSSDPNQQYRAGFGAKSIAGSQAGSLAGVHGGGYGEIGDARASRDSVVSGRSETGGTFFTGLRRDLQHGEAEEEEEEEAGFSSVRSSALNPILSPSPSLGGTDDDDTEVDEPIDTEQAEYMSMYDAGVNGLSEYSNPMMTPREATPTADVTGTSLHSMFRDLYEQPDGDSGDVANTNDTTHTEEQHPLPPSDEGNNLHIKEASEAEATGAEDEQGNGTGDGDVVEGQTEAEGSFLTEVKESMIRMEVTLVAQEQRRNELGEYILRLQTQVGEDGQALVEMPKNYLAMVEGLIRKQRGQYQALQGWLGPRRFEDLPINKLPDSDDDPKVTEGLSRIKELDGRLNDRTIEAMIVNRETFPEKYLEEETKRMQRHAKHVEETLKKQRMLHLRAAQLHRVVTSLDGSVRGSMPGSMTGSQAGGGEEGSKYSRFFQLRPEEEELVEAVLSRGEDAEEEVNPFDISLSMASALLEATSAYAGGAAAADAALAAGRGAAAAAVHAAHLSDDATHTGGMAVTPRTADLRVSTSHSIASLAGVQEAAAAVRGLPLSIINARLEEYMNDHIWDQDGSLADFCDVKMKGGGKRGEGPGSQEGSKGGPAPSMAVSMAPYRLNPQPPSPTGAASESRSVGTSSMTANGKRDYLREERENKALLQREQDIDTRIRAFKTGEYPARLDASTLAALVAEARKMEELRDERISASQPGTPNGSATAAAAAGVGGSRAAPERQPCASSSGRSDTSGTMLKPGIQRSRPPTLSAGGVASSHSVCTSSSPAASGPTRVSSARSAASGSGGAAPGAELFVSRTGQQARGKPHSKPSPVRTALSHAGSAANTPTGARSSAEGSSQSRPSSGLKQPSPGRAVPSHGIIASKPSTPLPPPPPPTPP